MGVAILNHFQNISEASNESLEKVITCRWNLDVPEGGYPYGGGSNVPATQISIFAPSPDDISKIKSSRELFISYNLRIAGVICGSSKTSTFMVRVTPYDSWVSRYLIEVGSASINTSSEHKDADYTSASTMNIIQIYPNKWMQDGWTLTSNHRFRTIDDTAFSASLYAHTAFSKCVITTAHCNFDVYCRGIMPSVDQI